MYCYCAHLGLESIHPETQRRLIVPQFIAVDHLVCTGCRECEVVCSLYHFGECNPERSAIRVVRIENDGLVAALPLVCQQCEKPPCIEACPTKAISREDELGILAVDHEMCSGCGDCVDACPAGCIFMDKPRNVAICCDLCGGRPQCVSLCHSHCLTLAMTEDTGKKDRAENLARILEEKRQWGKAAEREGR